MTITTPEPKLTLVSLKSELEALKGRLESREEQPIPDQVRLDEIEARLVRLEEFSARLQRYAT